MNKVQKKNKKAFTINISLDAIITWILAIFIAFVFIRDHNRIKELQKKVTDLETSQIATDELAVLGMQFSYELSERVDEITTQLP